MLLKRVLGNPMIQKLFGLKYKIFWPAKVVRKLGELTEIQLFDNENTKKMIQNTKLKPFQALKKLPNNKSKYWKEAYQLALSELNKE